VARSCPAASSTEASSGHAIQGCLGELAIALRSRTPARLRRRSCPGGAPATLSPAQRQARRRTGHFLTNMSQATFRRQAI
jgi:hypothetical protein